MSLRYGLPILFTVLAMAPGHAADVSAEAPSDMKRGATSMRWSRTVAVPTPAPSRIVIQGVEREGRFLPQSVNIPGDEPEKSRQAAFPVGENLLGRFEARPFGSEERGDIARIDDGLVIRCSKGTAPAGVVLETGVFHLPRAARLTLVAEGVGSGEPMGLSTAERGEDAPSQPQSLLGPNGGNLTLPSIAANERQARDIVISCPFGQADFQLASVSLEPDLPPAPVSRTGTWIWEADTWLERPGQVEEWAVASRLDRVILQLRIANGEIADGKVLADLVVRLGKRGILVHAVEGDPGMVTADGLDHALNRVATIRRYQLASRPDARLAGLQFDIEPYLLADFALDPAAVWARWAKAIRALSMAWEEKVSVVVPFWMLDSKAGEAAMAAVRTAISDVAVMAYRTETGEVTTLSEPWLAWGTLNGVPVRIALENGLLDTEIHQTFVRAETGILHLTRQGGTATVSLEAQPAPARDGGMAYAFSHETRVNPLRISFMGNQDRLAVARTELARLLVAWPSFDGLMIHALDETDRGAGGPRTSKTEGRDDEPQAPDPDL